MRLAAALILGGFVVSSAAAVDLKPETVQAFDRYIRDTETRLDQRLLPGAAFLWVDEDPQFAWSRCGRGHRQSNTKISSRFPAD